MFTAVFKLSNLTFQIGVKQSLENSKAVEGVVANMSAIDVLILRLHGLILWSVLTQDKVDSCAAKMFWSVALLLDKMDQG
jgi:hypothetical protein